MAGGISAGIRGTGLFYINEQMLPGIIDIQSATYDDPETVPARAHIQVAERIRRRNVPMSCPSSTAFRQADTGPPPPTVGQRRTAAIRLGS